MEHFGLKLSEEVKIQTQSYIQYKDLMAGIETGFLDFMRGVFPSGGGAEVSANCTFGVRFQGLKVPPGALRESIYNYKVK